MLAGTETVAHEVAPVEELERVDGGPTGAGEVPARVPRADDVRFGAGRTCGWRRRRRGEGGEEAPDEEEGDRDEEEEGEEGAIGG
jgi:hypothetical protein